MEKVYGLIV